MVRDAEHRPDRADASCPDEVTPTKDDQDARRHTREQPIRTREGWIKLADEFLKNESSDTRAGVDRCQYEKRLEHDRKVIPIRHQSAHAGNACENLRHADGKRNGTTRPALHALANVGGEIWQIHDGILRLDLGYILRDRRVDCEVITWKHGGRRDQSHQSDDTFHEHRAIPERTDVGFTGNHFWHRARCNERMESRYRATCDRDECERKHRSRYDRTTAGCVLRQSRHFEVGVHEEDADDERQDRRDFHEGAEIIAWCE